MADVDEFWVLAARKAGLSIALETLQDDVEAAARSAEAAAKGLVAPVDVRAEPWPPMQPGRMP